jgi:hypothetical protein
MSFSTTTYLMSLTAMSDDFYKSIETPKNTANLAHCSSFKIIIRSVVDNFYS